MFWTSRFLDDQAFSSSSDFNIHHAAKLARLNLEDGDANWSAKSNRKNQWLQVDLGEEEEILAVAVQGRYNYPQWVTKYNILISSDSESWTLLENIQGANDQNSISTYELPSPIFGRFVRFIPLEWFNHISMRVDVAIRRNTEPDQETSSKNIISKTKNNFLNITINSKSDIKLSDEDVKNLLQKIELLEQELSSMKLLLEIKENSIKMLTLKSKLIDKNISRNKSNNARIASSVSNQKKDSGLINTDILLINEYNIESDHSKARYLLREFNVIIYKIEFYVKIKNDFKSEIIEGKIIPKGRVVSFNAYHYAKNEVNLTKNAAQNYLESTWFMKGGRFYSEDINGIRYWDYGQERFWNNIGLKPRISTFEKRMGLITQPQILKIEKW